MKTLEFDLTEGGAFVRVPVAKENEYVPGLESEDFRLSVHGKKKSGQWVFIEAQIPRSQIPALARQLHWIIDLEQRKVDIKRAAMQGRT